jgi:hypothetical protein
VIAVVDKASSYGGARSLYLGLYFRVLRSGEKPADFTSKSVYYGIQRQNVGLLNVIAGTCTELAI